MKKMETKRLILRPFEMSDLPQFYAYARKPTIGPSAGWKPHGSIEESLDILKKFVSEDTIWAVVLKANNRLIGSIGLHVDRHRLNPKARSLGYVLDDEFWGQGIMVEAANRIIRHGFEDLGLDLISVTHYHTNYQSKRVIEKCRFQYEATLKMATLRYDGVLFDDVMYVITKEQYQEMKNPDKWD